MNSWGTVLVILFYVVQRDEALSGDGKALVAYFSTLKNPHILEPSWNEGDTTPCNWTGVKCTPQLRVAQISLPKLGLGGYIPQEFRFLTKLQILDLSFTNLSGSILPELSLCKNLQILDLGSNLLLGSIPAQFGKLKNLQTLSLFGNSISGSIPPELGLCSSLQQLFLYDNLLNGSIPASIGQLSNLVSFRAGGNPGLIGPIPSEIGNCSNLTVLGLAATSISGPLPASIGKLTSLQVLMLYLTNLSGQVPPEIGNCTNLETLYLYQSKFTGPFPAEIGKLKNLGSMLLWSNRFSGTIPKELGDCESLETIDLSYNRFSGQIPPELGRLKSLEELYISENNLTGPLPPEFGNWSSMRNLDLDTNALTGSIPAEFGLMTKLKTLHLWDNQLSGPIPASLGNCTELEVLDLSVNQLSGRIPAELFRLPKLDRLLLLVNSLTGELSVDLGKTTKLSRLRLNNNLLEGPIPSNLGLLHNLSFLDLHSNFFLGALPASLAELSSLQLLDIHGNQINGSIPPEYGDLIQLQTFDASYNRLSSNIPAELGNMKALINLYLGNNVLSGRIPAQLGRLKQLIQLDLSSNNLSGSIPEELGSLISLSIVLNLSSNDLTGILPDRFASLTHLEKLDLSKNGLEGTMDVLGRLTNLNFINVSYNKFVGNIPQTEVFRTMGAAAVQGNPFLSHGIMQQPYKHKVQKGLIISMILIGLALILFVVSLLALCRHCRSKYEPFGDSNSPWPWRMTPFQKLSFTVDDVLMNLIETNIIGHGRSGIVYKAQMPGGEVIAVKKLKASPEDQAFDMFAAEIDTLGRIRHRNIVRLLGYCSNNKIELLMYDYMCNGSLWDLLHEKHVPLDWDMRYMIALGAAQGIAYLHHDCVPSILHRDIKSNNILLGSKFEPYVADFGLAKLVGVSSVGEAMSKFAGSYGYMAPEYSYSLRITEKSDVYSYGVVLLEILTRRRPIEHGYGEDIHIVKWVQKITGDRLHNLAASSPVLDPAIKGMADPYIQEMQQVLGIALMCVCSTPSERPTMKDVVALLKGVKHSAEEMLHPKISQVVNWDHNKERLQHHYQEACYSGAAA